MDVWNVRYFPSDAGPSWVGSAYGFSWGPEVPASKPVMTGVSGPLSLSGSCVAKLFWVPHRHSCHFASAVGSRERWCVFFCLFRWGPQPMEDVSLAEGRASSCLSESDLDDTSQTCPGVSGSCSVVKINITDGKVIRCCVASDLSYVLLGRCWKTLWPTCQTSSCLSVLCPCHLYMVTDVQKKLTQRRTRSAVLLVKHRIKNFTKILVCKYDFKNSPYGFC